MKNKGILLAFSLVTMALLSGCTGAGFAKGVLAVGNDNATAVIKYGGVYGPVTVIRMNPKQGQNVTVNTDGSVTATWVGDTNAPAK